MQSSVIACLARWQPRKRSEKETTPHLRRPGLAEGRRLLLPSGELLRCEVRGVSDLVVPVLRLAPKYSW